MPAYRMIMLSQAVDGRDEDYERWYDETHIPEMLQVPGFVAAQRFRIVKNVAGQTTYPYCTIYEMDGDTPDAVLGAMFQAMQSGKVTMSDTADPAASQGFIVEEVRDRATRV
ncbi:MAG: hypothetical protein ABW203_07460 [Novosphingobium sp.]